jgi:hypothetical protein
MDPTGFVASVLAGLSLAAVAGLRAFLPLLATGIAGRLGFLPLSDSFAWLASNPALVVFGSAALIEILADKVPVLDHALDAVGLLIKPVAGAAAVVAVTQKLDPLWAAVLGIAVGGTVAGAVQVAKAKTRLGSSALTLGHANPVLSLAEDVASLTGVVFAVLWPLAAVFFVAAMVGLAWGTYRIARSLVAPRRQQPAG